MIFYKDVQDYGFMISAFDVDNRQHMPEQLFVKDRDELFKKIDELLNNSKNMISITPGTFHRFEAFENVGNHIV